MIKDLRIRTKIIFGFIIVILPSLLVGFFSINNLSKIAQSIEKDITMSVEFLSETSYLDSLAQFIRYYDEVLTQSVRNYAFTQDEKWKDRYYDNALKLEEKIKEAIIKGHPEDIGFFSDIESANILLVDMEERSMILTDNGQIEEAIELLEGDEYRRQKKIYEKGLVNYTHQRGLDYDEALAASTDILNLAIIKSSKLIDDSRTYMVAITIISILLAFILGGFISYYIAKPIINLTNVVEKIRSGNLKQKINMKSGGEIGMLEDAFVRMTEKLKKTRENIEKKVVERTEQLEKINKYMTGRELKMLELKKDIVKLKNGKEDKEDTGGWKIKYEDAVITEEDLIATYNKVVSSEIDSSDLPKNKKAKAKKIVLQLAKESAKHKNMLKKLLKKYE